jgi:hypothetical protein
VRYVLDDPEGIDLFGYSHLEFYISGGEASGQDPIIAGKRMSDLGIVPQSDVWTRVSIPILELPGGRSGLTEVRIAGFVQEAFYLDDMKLVAMEPPEPVAVEESKAKGLPSYHALFQNYPNPFNPVTTITYDLPKASTVTLAIYSITGQKVLVLVDIPQEAGHHTALFDGSGFASGIYFYRLEVGGFAETKRMMLLR